MSEELDPTINGRPISELKVVELKEELSKRGLSKAGNKNVLYDRLKKFLLDDSGDANVTREFSDASQGPDTPSSPPANPLVAEYLAKQEAALREARKDAEAALRSSSGEETSPSPKKVLRSRRGPTANQESDDSVIERRTTRSKTRSEIDQDHSTGKTDIKTVEVQFSSEENLEGQEDKGSAVESEFHCDVDEIGTTGNPETAQETGSTSQKSGEVTNDKDAFIEEIPSNVQSSSDVNFENKEQEKVVLEIENGADERRDPDKDSNEEEEVIQPKLEDCKPQEHESLVEREEQKAEPEFNQIQNKEESLRAANSENLAAPRESIASSPPQESVLSTELEVIKDNVEEEHSVAALEPETSQTHHSPSPTESNLPVAKALEDSNSEKVGDVAKVERKRRWKETSCSQEGNDKDIITVSAAETKSESGAEKDESENSEFDDKLGTEDTSEEKETVLVADEKDEELDYEEALEHASPASESSKNVKPEEEELSKKIKLEENESHISSTDFGSRREGQVKKRVSDANSSQEKREGLFEDGVKRRKVSPARYPVSEYLLIRQLTRPFTVKQLKNMLANYGALVEDGFWIDNIKSKCIVKYSSKEEAIVARGSLHNLVWPVGNPKELKVDFIDEAGFERFSKPDIKKDIKDKSNGSSSVQSSASLRISVGSEQRLVLKKSENQDGNQDTLQSNQKPERSPRSRHGSGHVHDSSLKREENVRTPIDRQKNEVEGKAKTADELFQKTKTQPAIYFAPLTEDQILERAKQKNTEAESNIAKRNTQVSRSERHKEEDIEKDAKYRLSPWRRQKSPLAQKRRRPSRSRSPRRP